MTSATDTLREKRHALILFSAGWTCDGDDWRHVNLNGGRWGWPALHAVRLQMETDRGDQDLVHLMLRGKT